MKTVLRRKQFSDTQSIWEVLDAYTGELLYTISINVTEGYY